MSARHNPNPYNIGDRVAFDRDFLKRAKVSQNGWAWKARGVISRIDGMICIVDWNDALQQNVSSAGLMLERKLK